VREGEAALERATVYRWNIRNGTGVVTRLDGSLAWFHFSTVDKGDVLALREGDQVDVEIENIPQGDYECRAVSVRRHIE
jgi:cold shock CspA family protein